MEDIDIKCNQDDELLSKRIGSLDNKKSQKQIKLFIRFLPIIILLIIFGLILKVKKEKNFKLEKKINLDLIPKNEDLSFKEEEHRKFSRQVAAETMVLATNNGLPIDSRDQVVLFGAGSKSTYAVGKGSGAVYNKGTKVSISPVNII